MPWVPQTTQTVAPGSRAQLGTITTSNQNIVVEAIGFPVTEVRLFGVVMVRRSLDLASGSFLAWRIPYKVWNTPEIIVMQNSAINDEVWFYVPSKFGQNLSVRMYRFV